jgi:excisionase family DNA binding protein
MTDFGPTPLPLSVRPKAAATLLSVGLTRIYELLNAGELVSFYDGRSRLITTDSIKAYIDRRVATAARSRAA